MDLRIGAGGVVRIGEEQVVEMRIKAIAESQQGKHAVMDCGEMAKEIDDAILARDDGLKQVGIAAGIEESAGAFDRLIPGVKAGSDEEVGVHGCNIEKKRPHLCGAFP
jgi:hypothetical protein